MLICLNIMLNSAASKAVNRASRTKKVVMTDASDMLDVATDTGIMLCMAHG